MNDRAVSALASPLNQRGLAHLRNRRFNEDPIHQGPAVDGKRTVWYKVEKLAVVDTEGASRLLEVVGDCFRNEGLQPELRLLAGTESDTQHTLSFAFPHDRPEAVNAAVFKINEASRRLEQGIAQSARGI